MRMEAKNSKGKKFTKFVKDVRLELKKVIWPTKQQLINNTLTVLVACLLVGIVIWIADFGVGKITELVFTR